MNGLMEFHIEAKINGPVEYTTGPIYMRYGDNTTPTLNVRVMLISRDRRPRDFNYTGYAIQFEAITPGGVKKYISSAGDGVLAFDMVNPSIGHFRFTLPTECVDAVGRSGMCYFRFVSDDKPQVSTGTFCYTVGRDVPNTATTPGGNGNAGGTTNHAALTNLGYKEAGHVGFASTEYVDGIIDLVNDGINDLLEGDTQ